MGRASAYIDHVIKEAIANPQAKMEAKMFKEGGDWEMHLSEFLSILDEIRSQDHVIVETVKIS